MTTLNNVASQIRAWQSLELKVGLVTGVFDLLHVEHIRFLTKAKSLGDKLIVGIETDNRVARMKGNHRPINPQIVRLEQLEALKVVDGAFILPNTFDQQTDWLVFMQNLRPDFYAVSSHSTFLENKQAICEQSKVNFCIVHPHNPAFSSTKLIKASPAAEEPQS